MLHHGVLGGAVAVGHEVAEGGVAVVADGLVEVTGVVRRCSSALPTSRVSPSPWPDAGQRAGWPSGRRDADEAGLLVERTADGLADPEGGVGGELEATAPVELVDGVLEAQVALLDEVEEIHALGQGVAAGDAHHEAQVGADEAVLGFGGGPVHPSVLRGDDGLQLGELRPSRRWR
jgi:hypothetical protein